MFDNIGSKVKTLATVSCIIGIVASIIIGEKGITFSGMVLLAFLASFSRSRHFSEPVFILVGAVSKSYLKIVFFFGFILIFDVRRGCGFLSGISRYMKKAIALKITFSIK